MENTGLTVEEFEDIVCERCKNNPIAYFCPACDYKLCSDCLPRGTRKQPGGLECRRCGSVDKKLTTFVGYGKI